MGAGRRAARCPSRAWASTRRTRYKLQVSTVQTYISGIVDDDGPVANESIAARISRQIEVCVLGRKNISRSRAMLATEIANLASSWVTWVARRLFTMVVGIQMFPGGIAIAVCWHREEMNVIG